MWKLVVNSGAVLGHSSGGTMNSMGHNQALILSDIRFFFINKLDNTVRIGTY